MNPEMNNSNVPENIPEVVPQENAENYPSPYPVGYDGSGVISSHPQSYQAEGDQMTQAPEQNQEKTENTQQAQKETNDVESLKQLNQILAHELQTYQQFLREITGRPNQITGQQAPQQQPGGSNDPLEQRLQQYKREAVAEARNLVNQELIEQQKIQELRKQNPDLAGDPMHEYFVENMFRDYQRAGWDFDTAATQAIKDYRQFLSKQVVNNQMQQTQQANVANVPLSKPDAGNKKVSPTRQISSPGSMHIEGTAIHSPSQTFKASELIDMQINKPSEYLRLQPQIMKAYQEGRVLLDE